MPAPVRGLVLAATIAFLVAGRSSAQLQTAVWNGASGNWDNPGIWTTSPATGFFPNNGNPAGTIYNTQVTNTSGGTITLDVNITIDQLAFSAGTIAGSASGPTALAMNTNLNWSGGTFSGGNINVTASGGATFPAISGTGPLLDAGTLIIGGNSTWSGTAITLQNGATLTNTATGVLTATADGNLNNGAGVGVFINQGTFKKSGTSGTTTLFTNVNNIGTLEAATGTLAIAGPLANLNGTTTLTGGTYRVQSNASLTLAPGATITAIAPNTTVELNGLNSNFPAVNPLAVVNGTFRLTNGRTFTTASNLLTAGTLDVQTGGILNVNGTLSVTGPASILNGQVNVSGTTAVNSALTVGAGATLAGANPLTVGSNGTLTVQGTVTQPVTVNSGGIITGNAHFTGDLNVQTGGFLKPGNSPGTITVGGNMTLDGDYAWDLAGNDNTSAGGTFDNVNVGGVTKLDPPSIDTNFGGTVAFSDPFWDQPRTWNIINTGSFFDSALPTLNVTDTSYLLTHPNGAFSLQETATALQIAWNPNAVPEPGTFVLVGGGLAAGWLARRRKLAKTV
jgi:hypothetical protein